MEEKQICCGLLSDGLPPLSGDYPWCVAQNLEAKDETEAQVFYNLHDPLSHYHCRIPELLGKRVRGCFHGWVILSTHPQNVIWSLWNPMTSKIIRLPPLRESDDPIRYCCLSSPLDDPNSILLLTRTGRPSILFCRLYKRKRLKWTEMTYAKQLISITGEYSLLHCLTCCNGKVYGMSKGLIVDSVVHVDILVKDREVVISLLPILELDCPSFRDCFHMVPFLKGSSTELFVIYAGVNIRDKRKNTTIGVAYLFKLNMTSMTWEELGDLNDTVFSAELGTGLSICNSPAITSKLGGYIHFFGEDLGKLIYSYHVKDKTLSLASIPCLVQTSHLSAWAMPKQQGKKANIDQTHVVRSVYKYDADDDEVTSNESHLLNLPFHILEMIMEFCVGIEYMSFRATCKRCHLAAPLIHWSNKTTLKRLQTYSLVSPWLMVFDEHKGIITFTDPMFGDNYFIRTPPQLDRDFKVYCSRYGWLLMGNDIERRMVFFNPFTSDILELPQVPCLQNFCFSAPPTCPDCMVVGFTTLGYWHVYIHFVAREPSWRSFRLNFGWFDGSYSFRFPTFYGHDVYVLGGREEVVDVFKDLSIEDFSWDEVVNQVPIRFAGQYFLAKCDQHLLLVIVGEFGESIEVFKLNDEEGKWEKIYSLGKHMIYICDTTCLCNEAKTPKMENTIYFPRLHSENGNIVFYSLETCKYHTFNGNNTQENFGDFFGTKCPLLPQVWIEPSWS